MGPIRETVLLLYQATAESLELSLRAHSEGRGSLEEVGAHRARLAQLDELAGSLGSRAGSPGSRQLSAPAELLHDAFYGALIDAGERLARPWIAPGAASCRWSASSRRRPRCWPCTGCCACWSRLRSD